jgi:hypothetical protein
VIRQTCAGARQMRNQALQNVKEEGVEIDIKAAPEVMVDSIDHSIQEGGSEHTIASDEGEVRGALATETDRRFAFGTADAFA